MNSRELNRTARKIKMARSLDEVESGSTESET